MFTRFSPQVAIFTLLFETMFIAIILLEIWLTPDLEGLKHFVPFANLIVILLSAFVLISIKQIEESSKKEMESRLLKEHLQQVEDLISSLNTQHHEHTRHIQTVQAMLYLNEVEKSREYLDGIADKYRDMQDLIYVGNPALTALLNSKRKVAEVKDIDFDFAVKCSINDMYIQPWDLCSIVGNLLDNALEAALEKENEKRVNLEIKYENKNYLIYVYNSGSKISEQQKSKIFHPGYTTKNSAGRGWGLYLSQKLVNKYGGTIELINEPRTTFIISLPERSAAQNGKNAVNNNSSNLGKSIAE